MNLELSKNPKEKAALRIIRKLKKSGYKAYFVGGCIRNKILNLPLEDIDIATNALPDVLMSLFPRTLSVGAHFGVILVLDKDIATEVATFRSDGIYLDNRHPSEVHFSDPQKDAMRRDFTINALFWDPTTGELLDFVHGQKDIEKKIVRCIGKPEDRFMEDALRLLRAVRFAARFQFRIEEKTWNAMKRRSHLIQQISADRIREELIKILTGPNRGASLDLLERSGLLAKILPEAQALKGVRQPEAFHPEGDCFEHTRLALEWLRNPTPTLAFGCLLHDIGKPPTYTETDRIRFNGHCKVGEKMAGQICRRLKFSNADRTAIMDLVARHMHFVSVPEMKTGTLRRFLSHPNIMEDLELHRADCLASHGDFSNYTFCMEKIREFHSEKKEFIPPPLLTGEDLKKEGYKPGPLFKKILNRIQEAQLEGEIDTREKALELVKREFPL
ncbi:CCA tRNA nucleotidyltransferase [Candidatus Sumerlaeota bacterium]|nr:CCA tRNA nucleotidyltransferase [Candidatus Sumerlaeota bacterium]